LLSPRTDIISEGYFFDAEAIRELVWIESLRRTHVSELDTIKLIVELAKEIRSLRRELHEVQHSGRACRNQPVFEAA
jgi:hypothetical protein